MTEQPTGECNTCGDNTGKRPARSLQDAMRDLWTREVTATPYPASVEAIAAANRGETAPAAMESPMPAPTATMERPRAPEAPATRPPKVEVSYLSAPWDQPPRANSTPIAERKWSRAALPQEPLGAIKADPRSNGSVEYLTWFPGGGSPWVQIAIVEGRQVFTGEDIPQSGLYADRDTVALVLREETQDCIWTVIVRKSKDGAAPDEREARKVAELVLDAAQAGKAHAPTLYVVKRADGTVRLFELDGGGGNCTYYIRYIGTEDRDVRTPVGDRRRVDVNMEGSTDAPAIPTEEREDQTDTPPPPADERGSDALPQQPPPRQAPAGTDIGKHPIWARPTLTRVNRPPADKEAGYPLASGNVECDMVLKGWKKVSQEVELDRKTLVRRAWRDPTPPSYDEVVGMFKDQVESLTRAFDSNAYENGVPQHFLASLNKALADDKDLCPPDCPNRQVISLDYWAIERMNPPVMSNLEYTAVAHPSPQNVRGWFIEAWVTITAQLTATAWFTYKCRT